MEITEDNILEVKQNIFFQAEVFINDIGEFAPFGLIYKSDKIIPLGYYTNEEIMNGSETIENMKKYMEDSLKKAEIKIAALAYDIYMELHSTSNKKTSALCLELSTGKGWETNYYVYKIIRGKCEWGV
ncbi:hypothetical protein [Flavobacterium rhizosphaerae]|uniref:Uncharacterized protein n=1 Tax=Flavobacterium rhizosphaerae TaxID=3163298 RepID=A0ABW8YYB0_9FLAO